MLTLMHVHFNFLCRTSRVTKSGESPIVLRIIYRRERKDLYTGLTCKKREWDPMAAKMFPKAKDAVAVNRNLERINHKAHDALEDLRQSTSVFSLDELAAKIKGEEQRPELLIEYLEHRNKELHLRVGVDITPTTFEKYARSNKHVLSFLKTEFKVKNYGLSRINSKFIELYFQYLRTGKKISHNTALKYLTSFKTMLMPAIKAGFIAQNPFTEFKIRSKPVYVGFLSDEEIQMLFDVELESRDLDRIRDIFLFSCFTGLAYSDLKQLAREHIVKQGEDFYLLKPRQKTGQQSIIPLLPPAMTILKKYSLTGDFRDFCWYVSSNQKMNQRLKLIGEAAGITKPLHLHLARHCFATTITLSNGIPLETVSSMLGHASLKQTQHYAKIVASKIMKDMAHLKNIYR